MPVQLEVWGDYALFTRPERKTERVRLYESRKNAGIMRVSWL